MLYDRRWQSDTAERPVGAAQQRELVPGKRTLVEMAYPHAGAIESALGRSIPGKAALDPARCEARGVPAFTDEGITLFASASPSLHVAAHEATHQLQHAGATRDGGMGAERHAHEVAEAVTSGGDARELLGDRGDAVAPAVRDYTELSVADQTARNQWVVGSAARVAETGKVVTSVTDRHVCFADPQLIASANQILQTRRSAVTLSAGPAGPTGDAPDGSGPQTTVRVVTRVASAHGGNNYADCGRMSREVQGPTGADRPSRAVYRNAGARRETAATDLPEEMRDEILVRTGLGATPTAARAAYLAMTPAQRDAFDRQHRINRYAAPNVGESYVSSRDDSQTTSGFNFHWGGVIMVSGPDRVTLENFARPGTSYDTQNALWYFDMYGPPTRPGQTWHDRWAEGHGREGDGVGAPGRNSMTMAAHTRRGPRP